MFQLDVTDDLSVIALSQSLMGRKIDLLINNASMLERGDTKLDKVDFDVFNKTLQVNTLGPLRVIQALMNNVKSSQEKVIVNISSNLGSIKNSNGRWYAYRSSKSALNQITKILSVEFKKDAITVVSLHPGWVRTDMGGHNANYSVKESVKRMIEVIEGLDLTKSGHFYDLKGKVLPW